MSEEIIFEKSAQYAEQACWLIEAEVQDNRQEEPDHWRRMLDGDIDSTVWITRQEFRDGRWHDHEWDGFDPETARTVAVMLAEAANAAKARVKELEAETDV